MSGVFRDSNFSGLSLAVSANLTSTSCGVKSFSIFWKISSLSWSLAIAYKIFIPAGVVNSSSFVNRRFCPFSSSFVKLYCSMMLFAMLFWTSSSFKDNANPSFPSIKLAISVSLYPNFSSAFVISILSSTSILFLSQSTPGFFSEKVRFVISSLFITSLRPEAP